MMRLSVALVLVLALLLPALPARAANAEQDFARARAALETLQQSPKKQRFRDQWQAVISRLEKIAARYPAHPHAAEARFLAGRAREGLFEVSRIAPDANSAVVTYDTMLRLHPDSPLADDALFRAGQLLEGPLHDRAGASERYQSLLTQFPQADHAPLARHRLQVIDPQALRAMAAVTPAVHPRNGKRQLSAIRFWSNPGYTRVVLDLTQSGTFSEGLLPADPAVGCGPRLFIDLPSTFPSTGLIESRSVADGLLRRIRTGQPSPGTMRVVLDLFNMSDHKIFALENPSRLVIDISGGPDCTLPSESVVTKPESVVTKPESVVTKPESVVTKPESAVTKPESAVTKSESAVTKSESAVTKSESAVTKSEPVVTKSEPVVTKSEPVVTKPEPAVTRVKPSTGKRPLPASRDPIAGIVGSAPSEKLPTLHVPAAPKTPLLRKIVVDAGHGGKDPGAIGPSGVMEKTITLAMAKLLAKRIEKELGCEVVMTRTRDVFIPLEERTAIANKVDADLFVSIHINANNNPSVRGVETYFLNISKNEQAAAVAARENGTTLKQVGDLELILFDLMAHSKINESSRLAGEIQRSLVETFVASYGDVTDHGVRQGPFYVLLGATMPSVLVESAYISNQADEKRLRSRSFQEKTAESILVGIRNYANSLNLLAER